MTDISDELRKVADEWDVTPLYKLADRIDAELVELPKGMDGVPIHVGDTVYLDDGHMAKVVRIELMQNESCIDCWVGGGKSVGYLPSGISHKPADSWERIAEELEAWCNSVDVNGDTCKKPRDIEWSFSGRALRMRSARRLPTSLPPLDCWACQSQLDWRYASE